MASWLQAHSPTRAQPRLWVERVWLVESKEPFEVIRTVDLHPGVNIVWAREPESNEASGLASAGHGVGKTSFCLLLRYCLGDDAPSITSLREKASAGFPKGGVAAKVHIDGATWLVYRPYGGHSQSVAGLGDSLEDLLAGGLVGDFQSYAAALQAAFIGKLAATTLPGSNQPLEWRHLLAWCIRDQKTRFDGFFHWRDGDGLGFRRSRQDPPLFVRAVLGLLDAEVDRLMRTVEATQSALNELDERLPELERAPIYALDHVERQLRARLRVDDEMPVLETMLGSSLESMVREALAAAELAEALWDRESDAAEQSMAPHLVKLAELQYQAAIQEKERGVAQSLVEANEAEYIRLTNELKELDRLAGHCKYGLVDFSECVHIVRRRASPSLPWHMSQKDAKLAAPRLQAELDSATKLAKSAQSALQVQIHAVSNSRATVRRLQMRTATSANQREALKSLWAEFLLRRAQREQGTDSPELERTKERRANLSRELDSHKVALVKRHQEHSERAESLKALTRCIAERLLGEEGYGRFVPESDVRLFELAVGGEAYQVLEVLLGDITCIVDAATSTASNHPGFLVHDCPREADMSERLYREFLLMTAEAEEQFTDLGGVPFQYIVTTTSAPPRQLRTPVALVLELKPGAEEYLLFKRRLMTSLPGMDA